MRGRRKHTTYVVRTTMVVVELFYAGFCGVKQKNARIHNPGCSVFVFDSMIAVVWKTNKTKGICFCRFVAYPLLFLYSRPDTLRSLVCIMSWCVSNNTLLSQDHS